MANNFSFPPPPPPPSRKVDYRRLDYRASGGISQSRAQQGSDADEHSWRDAGRTSELRPLHDYNVRPQPHDRQPRHITQTDKQDKSLQHHARHDGQSHWHGRLGPKAGSTPDRSFAGHKRKLEALHEPKKPKQAGSETVPAVPSFGTSLTPSCRPSQLTHINVERRSKPSLFGLGNPPRAQGDLSDADLDEDVDDDEQDDTDEEATYARLGTSLVFEYEGTVVKLDSEADLAKWHEERRRRWPSSAKVAEKQAQRQRTGLERKRLLEGAYQLRQPGFKFRPPRQQWMQPEAKQDESRQEQTLTTPNPSHGEQEALQSAITATGLPGISMYDSDGQSGGEHEADVDASKVAEFAIQQEEHDSGEEAPEEMSSKAVHLQPPSNGQRACKYFFRSGRCQQGENCDYRHEAQTTRPVVIVSAAQRRGQLVRSRKMEESQGRKGIHQLLIEQEGESANRLALQVIKYLGGVGFFETGQ